MDPHLDDIYQPCCPIFDLGRQSSHAKNRLKPWITIPDAPCMEYLPLFTYIWAIFGINVGKYSIHGASGHANLINPSAFRQLLVGRKPSCGPNRYPNRIPQILLAAPEPKVFVITCAVWLFDIENMENPNHKWRF